VDDPFAEKNRPASLVPANSSQQGSDPLETVDEARPYGTCARPQITAQVAGRPVSVIPGVAGSLNPRLDTSELSLAPAGGRRLVQRVDGHRATLVAGTPVFENGEDTGARPGRLVRAGRL
jgi:hypothetical protein